MNADLLQDLLVIVLNVSVMLAMGLDLTVAQLRDTLRRVVPLASGLLLNLVVVPLLGAAAIALFALPPAAALGILLCATAAGGPTGPLLTSNARGDVAYSVALVLILSFASIVAVPALLRLLGGASVPVGNYAGRIVGMIVLWQILPLCAGMLLRAVHARSARPLHVASKALGNLTLLVLTVALLITKGEMVLANGARSLLACLLLVVATLLVGLPLARLTSAYGRALMFTTAIRNLALALLLASQVFRDPVITLSVLTYGLFMFGISLPAALLVGRRVSPAATARP